MAKTLHKTDKVGSPSEAWSKAQPKKLVSMKSLFSGTHVLMMVCLVSMISNIIQSAPLVSAKPIINPPGEFLEGVGYREQELQVPKGAKFQPETPTGVKWASFAGYTHIFVKGNGLDLTPTENRILLYSQDFAEDILLPPLTEADSFNSNPDIAAIAYRLPAVWDIFGFPKEQFDHIWDMKFYLQLQITSPTETKILQCSSKMDKKCLIHFSRSYTPIIYHVTPPVAYKDSKNTIWFDPKDVTSLIDDLPPDEYQFINAKIADSRLDFETTLSTETKFGSWRRNKITGVTGEVLPGKDQSVNMVWETGHADVNEHTANVCNYDNTYCYKAKTVPVIQSISGSQGYTTGGMNVTVTGFGFNSENIVATADGQPCTVTKFSKESFSCSTGASPSPSVASGLFKGNHGVRSKKVDGGTSNLDDPSVTATHELLMTTEHLDQGDSYSKRMSAWFIAPATAKVRFYQSCDDTCKLYFNDQPDTKIDRTATAPSQMILDTNTHTGYKTWYNRMTLVEDGVTVPAAGQQDAFSYQTQQIDKDILSVTNDIRKDPAKYVTILQARLPLFNDPAQPNLYDGKLMTNEGKAAVEEAITFLQGFTPVTTDLKWDQYLEFACTDHVTAQGATQETGHDSPDGTTFTQRVDKYGTFITTVSENLQYGDGTAEDIVLQLVIDDGVSSRGHRTNIFSSQIAVMGTKTGPHGKYNQMSCMNYAGGMTGKATKAPLPATDPANGAQQQGNMDLTATLPDNMVSPWFDVVQGQHYHLEQDMSEKGGDALATVGFEIERPSGSPTHPHQVKQIQHLEVRTQVQLEKTRFTIEKPDDKEFVLQFLNPVTGKYWISDKIQADTSASKFNSAIKGFYWGAYYASIYTELRTLDSSDQETSVDADIVKREYTVSVNKMMKEPTTTGIQLIPINTKASVNIELPPDVQLSGTPIEGSYQITCENSLGQIIKTADIKYYKDEGSIENSIMNDCLHMQDKIDVIKSPRQAYRENGIAFMIRFTSKNEKMGVFKITSGNETDLTGDSLEYKSQVLIDYQDNLLYDTIPFEMLKTFEEKPQFQVDVDGEPAVCSTLDCGFSYVTPSEEITSFTFTPGSGSPSTLAIQGTGLPTDAAMIDRVSFANTDCKLTANTATSIDCELQGTEVVGKWQPEVYHKNGLIPMASTLTTQESVAGSITNVDPKVDINVLGESDIKITGTNFPTTMDGNTVKIEFTDSGTVVGDCSIESTSSTEIICKINEFIATTPNLNKQFDVKITINGEVVTNAEKIDTVTTIFKVNSLVPDNASPVLHTKIEFNLEGTFPETLVAEDFTVKLISKTDPTYIRPMNVGKVDDAAKKFEALFTGAKSGDFDVSVLHKKMGKLDASALTFKAFAEITSYTPSKGSIYGGQLLTISGNNWGNEITDNPVQISYNGALGSTNCWVEETSATEIKCRIEDMRKAPKDNGKTGRVVAFMKTYEDTDCGTACDHTFTDDASDLHEITAVNKEYDTVNNVWKIRVTGNGFKGDPAKTVLMVGSKAQVSDKVDPSDAYFPITDIDDSLVQISNLYFEYGTPKGFELLEPEITLEPKFTEVNPQQGSLGGTIITATVHGVGINTQDVDILDTSDVSICEKVTVVAYSQVECLTKAQTIGKAALKIKVGAATHGCANTVSASCEYEQNPADSFPVTTSVTKTDSKTIEFIGSDYFTSNYDAVAKFLGIAATTVVIDSDSKVTATWDRGVPITTAASLPELSFVKNTRRRQLSTVQASKLTHFSQIPATALVVNTLNIASTTDVTCSFAGGCLFEIQSTGLSSMMEDSANNFVTVCDNVCEYSYDDSSETSMKCKVPSIATTYSNANFKISEVSDDLKGTNSGSSPEFEKIFDNQVMSGPNDNSANCHAQIAYKKDFVGQISSVKWFLNTITDKTKFLDTKFQGSADGAIFTDLFQFDENLHEGWNYYNWESANMPAYRYYRFSSITAGGCNINEIKVIGSELILDNSPQKVCPVVTTINGVVDTSASGQVTYEGTATPKVDDITPRYGKVTGGTQITFTGSGFGSDMSKISIIIDKQVCTVDSASNTEVKCTAAARPGIIEPSLEFYIKDSGNVALQGNNHLYVSSWMDTATWGGDFLPQEGDSISIPTGMNLLVDIKNTPKLNAVFVEGSLIFMPDADKTHVRTFDAHYIFVHKGRMEVGTEDFPYDSKVIITMWSRLKDPYLPIYGNKVLGVRYGQLDMHGVKRTPTWTVMETTANAGDDQITLQEPVDWQVGEDIAIASTDYNGRHAEQRTISAINANGGKPIITLDRKLEFKHYAATETYGSDDIDMRAEVGLLTRSVKFRGDPVYSKADEYGAAIFAHSAGDDSLITRLNNIELEDSGQAFKIGRYSIHFHMIGSVHKSYVKGCAVHSGFNRAFTMHGTNHLRIEDNVAYKVKGHTVFIEDAAEKKNLIKNNLIIDTRRSMSGLNTDQTPACFWITHPDNSFVDNHAAGSDRYGYWYDLQTHAIGPNANKNVCPENHKVGEFKNNHAHSVGRYGLRIFHNMRPRKFPCKSQAYDWDNPSDPYHKNPNIEATLEGLTSWKNGRNGAIAEQLGSVVFKDFKVADNKLAGIEVSNLAWTDIGGRGLARIENALIIGNSANQEGAGVASAGIWTPKVENFLIKGAKFFNMNGGAGFRTCSHCFHPASTNSDARTTRVEGLEWDANSPNKIRYSFPDNQIFLDLDGSLTGKGANTMATKGYKWLEWPECSRDDAVFDGVTCDPGVQIRRLVFYMGGPNSLEGMGLKIMQYDDNQIDQLGDKLDKSSNYWVHRNNSDNYDTFLYTKKLDPLKSWPVPWVTGHKYHVHWGKSGVDFEDMNLKGSNQWLNTDKPIYFVHNFTDVRAKIDVKFDGGDIIPNNTIENQKNPFSWQVTGQNVVYNKTDITNNDEQSFHWIWAPASLTEGKQQELKFKGHRCDGPCNDAIGKKEIESTIRLWSDPNSWTSGKVPVDDDVVEVEPGWNMLLDVPETAKVRMLTINGRLTFKDDMDVHLRASHIFVRVGELIIGNETNPYTMNAKITLNGWKNERAIVYDNAIEAGNKLIANIGTVKMIGSPTASKMSRLQADANKGDSKFTVEKGLDWKAGDQLGLLPTSYDQDASDFATIDSYDSATGEITIKEPLNFYHFGQATTTGTELNGLDMRGEVIHLTRNIRIVGEDVESWGCQFVTSDTAEYDVIAEAVIPRISTTILDGVEMYNCSQIDTSKAAIRFEYATGASHSVKNSAFHNGFGWGLQIKNSANVNIQNSNFFSFRQIGGNVESSKNIKFDNNVIADVKSRTTIEAKGLEDREAGFASCTLYSSHACPGLEVTNNIVAGTKWTGFTGQGHECGDSAREKSNSFKNNVGHSVCGSMGGYGAIMIGNRASADASCHESSHFSSYKNCHQGVITVDNWAPNAKFSHMNMVDNAGGVAVCVGMESFNDMQMTLEKSTIVGEWPASQDCPTNGGFCSKKEKAGIYSFHALNGPSDVHPTMPPAKPHYSTMGDGSWGGVAYIKENVIKNYPMVTTYGKSMTFFKIGLKLASDIVPTHTFWGNTLINVDSGGLVYFADPPQKWANPTDCVEFPCSAPNNILTSWEETKYGDDDSDGGAPTNPDNINFGGRFQLIHNNPGFAPHLSGCEKKELMNAYLCRRDYLGLLQFQSLDPDAWDRTITPIYVMLQGTAIKNKLNSHMDHIWDGFYTGQKHMSRYPSIIDGTPGSVYDLEYTGSPPKQQRFFLRCKAADCGMTIRIHYPSAESRNIEKDGEIVEFNQWDEQENYYGPIKQSFCGENRYLGVKNIFEFYISTGCTLFIKPRDAIQTLVRMEWTFDQFYADGGSTKLVDRLAASIGIHASNIKTVSVYEGSLVFHYQITSSTNSLEELAQIQNLQIQLYAQNKMNLGGNILDVSYFQTNSAGAPPQNPPQPQFIIQDGVVKAQGYAPIIITKTDTNSPVNPVNPSGGGASGGETNPVVNPSGGTVISGGGSNQISSNERDGQSQYNVYDNNQGNGKIFQPDVKIIMDTSGNKQSNTQNNGIVQTVQTDQMSTVIIVTAVVTLLIVMACFGLRMLWNKTKLQIIEEALERHKQIQEVGTEADLKKEANENQRADSAAVLQTNQSNIQLVGTAVKTEASDVKHYQEQYDPNQDFAIFAAKDKKTGGFIGLKEKMNLADQQSEKSMDSDAVKADQFYQSQKKLQPPKSTSPEMQTTSSPQELLPKIQNKK